MAVQEGIEGVDLLELKIIADQRLPPVTEDFTQARGMCTAFDGSTFERSGAVGNYPSGPAQAYQSLAGLLADALTQSIANLTDTSTAIRMILDEILEADAGAQARMQKAQNELNGVSGS